MSPRKITKILQHLHLQGQMGYKRIKELKEFNLLEEERITENEKGKDPGRREGQLHQQRRQASQYRTTPKGREYVELYNRLSELYPSVSPKEEDESD
jgi:hypothetical protein